MLFKNDNVVDYDQFLNVVCIMTNKFPSRDILLDKIQE